MESNWDMLATAMVVVTGLGSVASTTAWSVIGAAFLKKQSLGNPSDAAITNISANSYVGQDAPLALVQVATTISWVLLVLMAFRGLRKHSDQSFEMMIGNFGFTWLVSSLLATMVAAILVAYVNAVVTLPVFAPVYRSLGGQYKIMQWNSVQSGAAWTTVLFAASVHTWFFATWPQIKAGYGSGKLSA